VKIPTGWRIVHDSIIVGITLARRAGGERRVDDAVRHTGDEQGSRERRRRQLEREDPKRQRLPHDECRDQPQRLHAPRNPIRDRIAHERPDAERGEQPAGDARVGAEARDHEHGHGDEERSPRHVADREGRVPDAQERVAEDEPESGANSSPLRFHKRLPLGDECCNEQDGDDVGRAVEEQHARRADDPDHDAGQHGAEQQRHARRGLGQRACLRDYALVLAEKLRHDHLLGREVRRRHRAHREGDREQKRERERAAPVQNRDEHDQRRPHPVADQHRPPSS
jgi:hypothetical protein